MAVGYNGQSSGSGSASSITVNHTVGTNSNRFLCITLHFTASVTNISGTYNGVPLSLLSNYTNNGRTIVTLYLFNPSSGTNSLYINWGALKYYYYIAYDFYNVVTYYLGKYSDNSFNVTVDSVSGELIVGSVFSNEQTGSITVLSGGTQIAKIGGDLVGVCYKASSGTTTNIGFSSNTNPSTKVAFAFRLSESPNLSSAIDYDYSKYSGNSGSNVTSISHNHSVGIQRNNALIVHLYVNGNISGVSVTYAGVAMTYLDTVATGNLKIHRYYLLGVSGGFGVVAASWTTSGWAYLASISFSNVAKLINGSSSVGSSTTPSHTMSSSSREVAIVAALSPFTNTWSPNANQKDVTALSSVNAVLAYKPGDASVTIGWTYSSNSWLAAGVTLKPPGAGGSQAIWWS